MKLRPVIARAVVLVQRDLIINVRPSMRESRSTNRSDGGFGMRRE